MDTPKKHYIAMSGTHGCLPDHCEVFKTRKDAVSDLVSLFELGRTRTARLRKESYLELTPSAVEKRQDLDFGAEYCEITECDCATPEVHSDSGEFEDTYRFRCNQCEACMINGVFCHETGCPNSGSRYDIESGEWIKQRKCFECGCTVDNTDPCCSAPFEEDEN